MAERGYDMCVPRALSTPCVDLTRPHLPHWPLSLNTLPHLPLSLYTLPYLHHSPHLLYTLPYLPHILHSLFLLSDTHLTTLTPPPAYTHHTHHTHHMLTLHPVPFQERRGRRRSSRLIARTACTDA